jgi:hypothetical protein
LSGDLPKNKHEILQIAGTKEWKYFSNKGLSCQAERSEKNS